MAREIERKFVLEGVPDWLGEHEGEAIEQGYLAIVEGVREVRLRRREDQRILTVKLGSGEDREEVEVDLSDEQFEGLWALTEGLRLEKTRYEVPHGDLTIEVDVYEKLVGGHGCCRDRVRVPRCERCVRGAAVAGPRGDRRVPLRQREPRPRTGRPLAES